MPDGKPRLCFHLRFSVRLIRHIYLSGTYRGRLSSGNDGLHASIELSSFVGFYNVVRCEDTPVTWYTLVRALALTPEARLKRLRIVTDYTRYWANAILGIIRDDINLDPVH